MTNQLKELVNNPHATLVDVRTPLEFSSENIPGSLNIPLDQVNNRVEEFRAMAKPLILFCQSGNRSGIAAGLLRQAGIDEVYNGGGIMDMKYFLN